MDKVREPSPEGRGNGGGANSKPRPTTCIPPAFCRDAGDEAITGRSAAEAFAAPEPCPTGRGQGEGADRVSDGAVIVSARRPHPNPPERSSKGPEGREYPTARDGNSWAIT